MKCPHTQDSKNDQCVDAEDDMGCHVRDRDPAIEATEENDPHQPEIGRNLDPERKPPQNLVWFHRLEPNG
jgi:hypothetical protein